MTAELHQTNVNMEGLLEVLGKNLYSTPNVAIRELVQNAHDACIRRRIEDNSEQDLRIRLSVEPNSNCLIIEDNGSGLTYSEVNQFLATIGSGYTRLLRNSTDSDEMIGYFGLGFLSAYVISSKVDVITTSFQEPDKTWHFSSKGGRQFTIDTAPQSSIGTRVRLKISNEYRELTSLNVLRALLRKFCCLLPIKIYVDGDEHPINNLDVPWLLDTSTPPLKLKREQLKFAEIFEDTFNPICVIPIPANDRLKVNGLIWIQDNSGYSTSDFRNVSVFVRNMFITHEGRDLLPLWAGFAGCIVESHSLTPTASREDIQKDEAFDELRNYLLQILVNGLKDISASQPENWRRILSRHNQALLGAAVNDDLLFDILKDSLKVPTNDGEMTLQKLLSKSDNKIHVRLEQKNNYEDVLFRARMIPIVSGYMFAASSFCHKYSEYAQLSVIQLGTKQGDLELFKPLQTSSENFYQLEQLIKKDGDQIILSSFEPVHVPMVIVEDKDIVLKEKMEQEGLDKRIGSAALGLAKLHTNKINSSIRRRVYINVDCPLIERLTDNSMELGKAKSLADLLRSFMVTMCHDASNRELNFSDELNKFCRSLIAML
jgi:molecular chaperone HtpG